MFSLRATQRRAWALRIPVSNSIHILQSWPKSIDSIITVRRVLPALTPRRVGPFVFFDHMSATMAPGQGMDVRPHPHIGLSTITYLFEGNIMHRDSLGSVQKISPGDVNWMTSGRGIVHSERTPEEDRATGSTLQGIQTWLALPQEQEGCDPSFEHYKASMLPKLERDGVTLKVILGKSFGLQSPVKPLSPTLYATAKFGPQGTLEVGPEYEERAVYLVDGDLSIDSTPIEPLTMAVLSPQVTVQCKSERGAVVMILGGQKLDGERKIVWNFVASSKEAIDKAKLAWEKQELGKIPGEESDWIPLPEKERVLH